MEWEYGIALNLKQGGPPSQWFSFENQPYQGTLQIGTPTQMCTTISASTFSWNRMIDFLNIARGGTPKSLTMLVVGLDARNT